MSKQLIWLFLFVSLLFPRPATAQGGTQLASAHIELWPEYDQASMLVIQEFVVKPAATLPAEVNLRIPQEANLIAVASNSAGQLVNAEFDGPTPQGDWNVVSITVRSREPYRIEYYQPLQYQGDNRSFEFTWFGDYAVDDFAISALLPADSEDVVTDPALPNIEQTANGLFLSGSTGTDTLQMGQSFPFRLSYARPSTALTNPASANGLQPVDPIGSDTAGRVSVDKLPWIIGGFGLALIAIILFLFSYWHSMQSNIRSLASSAMAHRRRRPPARDRDSEQLYCHECGARAKAGDRFCRVCGSKLRTS